MKKFLAIIGALTVFFTFSGGGKAFDDYDYDTDAPKIPVTVKAGTFLKVVNLAEINSSVADIGDRFEFLNKSDMFVGEYNVFPVNTKFYGVAEDVREPVQGTNGAIKIRITKIVTPEHYEYFPNAYIYSASDNYLGGGKTPPLYYKKVPHYSQGLSHGVLQFAPINIFEYGKPHKIKPGEELFVILTDDLKIN